MPTPVGHTLSGIFLLYAGYHNLRWNGWLIAWVTIFALLPDIDLLYGLVVAGDANAYHHQATHSLAFVLAAGLAGGRISARWGRMTGLLMLAGILHLGLDLLAVDTSAPRGIPLLWPLWKDYVISPLLIFSDVHRSGESHLFLASLLSWHNLKTVLVEIVVFVPLFIACYGICRRNEAGLKGTS